MYSDIFPTELGTGHMGRDNSLQFVILNTFFQNMNQQTIMNPVKTLKHIEQIQIWKGDRDK